jgi:argininosuccinate lyase
MRQAAFEGYATATDLADYLVKKGMPFRDAHEVVALAVKHAVNKDCDLSDLSLDELQQFSSTITEDVFSVLTLEGSVASRNHIGGTAPAQVLQAVARAKNNLKTN